VKPTSVASAAFNRVEDALASLALLVMVVLPLAEIVMRRFAGGGILGSTSTVQHLTLWVGFLGASIAARDGRLLALATGTFMPEGRARRVAEVFAAAVTAAVALLLVWGGVQLVVSEREVGGTVGPNIPTWIAQAVLPVSVALIAVRVIWRAAPSWTGRAAAATGLVAAAILWRSPYLLEFRTVWPGLLIIAAAGALGAPIFAILGGFAALLFLSEGATPVMILIKTYTLAISPTLPAIPLFTLAGFLLAEGRSSERLLRVFRGWFGWIPGGTAVVCALLCSFFTVFTGGSGVTILALGGLLYPALIKEGYRERFSLGLLTASGSLGLLLPPALPLIVYAVVAQRPIEDMFLGGVLPGILLTTLIAGWGVREGIVTGAGRTRFERREALASLWEAKWELSMPVVVLGSIFSGYATPVESSALTAFYALVVQTLIHRDLSVGNDLLRVFVDCISIVGGVFVILGVAVGLTDYMVGAQIPARLLELTQAYVHSPFVFLLGLNLFLLVVGCLMDIFSATVVVVPLIVPLGEAFGIHPVHLGIIFIANLELGYLTPPVGLNLFLASYRFKKPLLEVARASLPMLAILGIGVLLITYVPWLTTGLLQLFGRY
jgi:tripartite ATP-independent transporter DctM subunit